VAWAALAQSVCLSILMSIRDPLTPLKIIGLAAMLNVLADFLLCVWPLHTGCAGAAAATAFATLVSCGFMLKALSEKDILPSIRIPSKAEFISLLDYTGPLLAITITRMAGFVAMQKTATRLGTETLAGYQVCVNLLIFFLLFGEPLSQISQTKLPGFLDQQDSTSIRECLKSVSILAAVTSVVIAAIASSAAQFGAAIFTSDAVVQEIARTASPSLFFAVIASILAVAVDGALMASRDYTVMLVLGICTFAGQLLLLQRCTTVSNILLVFALRLGTYACFASGRIVLGFGQVGKCLKVKTQLHG
jgi:Na+-driven multidrug efflux pump